MLALTERVIITALKDWNDFAGASGVACEDCGQRPGVGADQAADQHHGARAAGRRAENWPGLILEVTEDEIIRDLTLANESAAEKLKASHCRAERLTTSAPAIPRSRA